MSTFGNFTVTRASSKRVLGSAGTLVTYGNNEPAFEFNADGSYRGLSGEPGATNLFQRSEEFDNAYWTKTNATITANATTAPDGTTTAEKYIANNGAPANSPLVRSVTLLANTTYTLSLFVKKADYDTANIRIFTTETGFSINSFNLSNGTATNNQIQALPNGWFRVWVSLTTSATVDDAQVQLIRDAQVRDGVAGIFIWGAQIETGSVATSYIPTVASTASRSADSVTLTGASSLIGQTEGTLYAEVDVRNIESAISKRIFSVSDGTTNNQVRIELQKFGSPSLYRLIAEINQGGSIIFGLNTTSSNAALTTASILKTAFAYKDNDYALFVNGTVASGTTSGSGTLSNINATQVELGVTSANTFQLNDNIRAAALYKTRLSNTQLAALTTP